MTKKESKQKKKRKEAKAALMDFCELHLNNEDRGSITFKRNKVESQLKNAGIPSNSHDFTLLQRAYGKHMTQIRSEEPAEPPTDSTNQQRIKYIGKVFFDKTTPIAKVKTFPDHVILSLHFKHDNKYVIEPKYFEISWKFNEKGKIWVVNAEANTYSTPHYVIVSVCDFRKIPTDYKTTEAFYKPCPREIAVLGININEYPQIELCEQLIKKGHQIGGEILQKLKSGKFDSDFRPKYLQEHLITLLDDKHSKTMIEKANSLMPTVNQTADDKKIEIKYK